MSKCLGMPVLLLLATLAAACTVGRRHATPPTPAPVEFLAWLCADSCRVEFAAADPLPYHAGAPATRLDDGAFEVRYQRRSDGRWAPRADGRLIARLHAGAELPEHVDYSVATGLDGWRAPVTELLVRVEQTPAGAVVHTTVTGDTNGLAAAALRHLQAAVAFAEALARQTGNGGATTSCCSRHAGWRAIPFVRSAQVHMQAHRLVAARDALRAAAAIAPRQPELDYHIADLDRSLGHDALAATRMRDVSRHSLDPGLRSGAAIAAADADRRERLGGGTALRLLALQELDCGRVDAAAALALAAVAAAPDPLADLRIRHRLQTANKDRYGSLGTALLLREYATDPSLDRLLAQDFSQVGHWQLAGRAAARLLVGQLPAADMLSALQSASTQVAHDAWIGWSEAVGAMASPPR